MPVVDEGGGLTETMISVPIISKHGSLAATEEGAVSGWFLITALLLFPLGLLLPIVKTKMFVVFADYYSILGVGFGFLEKGDLLLGLIVLVFSVVFPTWKLWTLYKMCFYPKETIHDMNLRRLEMLGKWSMLDVFVVALVVFTLKGGAGFSALLMPGAYFFGASILLTMIASDRIVKLLKQQSA